MLWYIIKSMSCGVGRIFKYLEFDYYFVIVFVYFYGVKFIIYCMYMCFVWFKIVFYVIRFYFFYDKMNIFFLDFIVDFYVCEVV